MNWQRYNAAMTKQNMTFFSQSVAESPRPQRTAPAQAVRLPQTLSRMLIA
ncbi:hypothetical protein HPTD01_2317 [Halomonas sp. TD01]|nr:hypothetical protein GME_02039 [Halomonas sp. TD01]CAH1043839.1 hypothetical protein HPTD01_2317 [Halomonas sp. TD01]